MANAPASSGRWTNLRRYIDANQDSSAVQGTIDGINKNATDSAEVAQGSYNTLNSTQAGAGAKDMDAEDQKKLGLIGSTGAYSPEVGAQQEWLSQIDNKYANGPGQYSGATQADVSKQYDQFSGDLSKYQNNANALNSDGQDARKQQLTNTYGKDGGYTKGQASLDSLFTEKYGQPQFANNKAGLDSRMSGVTANGAAEKAEALNSDIQKAQTSYGDMSNKWQQGITNAKDNFSKLTRHLEENAPKPVVAEAPSVLNQTVQKAPDPKPTPNTTPPPPGQIEVGRNLPLEVPGFDGKSPGGPFEGTGGFTGFVKDLTTPRPPPSTGAVNAPLPFELPNDPPPVTDADMANARKAHSAVNQPTINTNSSVDYFKDALKRFKKQG